MERRKVRRSFFVLRLVGAFLAVGGGTAEISAAQAALHLTVRPHEMATATRTERAGLQTVDGKPKAPPDPSGGICGMLGMKSGSGGCIDTGIGGTGVYVPQQCVGAQRCPLVILSNTPYEYYLQVADKYGMILGVAGDDGSDTTAAVASLDRDIQQILRTFAIDPDKIVIAGRCATGPWTSDVGAENLGIFSRIAVFTQHMGNPAVKAPKQTNEYYISGGLLENIADFWDLRRLRDRGYSVKYSLQLRGHTHTYEDYDFMGHWLQESWAIPDPAARPVPYTFGDPPLLTAEAMAQMTAFWTRFMEEPESIKTTARQALVREVMVPVGKERVSTLMVDMPALAAQRPSVAAAFKAAKLTPQQHDAYRAALISARIYENALATYKSYPSLSADSVGPFLGIVPTSAMVKNFEFMSAHPDESTALEATEMWITP